MTPKLLTPAHTHELQRCSIAQNVKDGLHDASFVEKIRLLSLIPDYISSAKIQSFFEVSRRMCENSELEIFGEYSVSRGHNRISDEIIQRVLDFYRDDSISRLLPGQTDCVSVKENGVRIQKQKRLLLDSISELYETFRCLFPNDKVGISKFCSVRPKECITVNSKGLHNVCVCKFHQNVKLMHESVYRTLSNETSHEFSEMQSSKHILSFVRCCVR